MKIKKKLKGKVINPEDRIAVRAIELESGNFLIEKDDTITNFLNRNKEVI